MLPPTVLIHNSLQQAKPNVAGLGESLYTTHLVTVGLAGVLLFVWLIGAFGCDHEPEAVGSAGCDLMCWLASPNLALSLNIKLA